MKQGHTIFAALAALLMAGAAQAQVRDVESPTGDYGLAFTVLPKQTGHDKCVGQGHQNSNGGGHEEGECEEPSPEETPTGPVATTICDADPDSIVESSWTRASCATVSYNENFLTAVVGANESYPTELTAYVSGTATTLTSPATVDLISAYGIEVLADLGNGGNLADVIGPINPPQPRDDFYESVMIDTAGLETYSTSLVNYSLNRTVTVIDALGNGGNLADVIGPINPPQPRRDATLTLSATSATLSTGLVTLSADSQPATAYTTDVGTFATQSIDAALVGGNYDGGNLADVIGPINPPQPRRDAYTYSFGF